MADNIEKQEAGFLLYKDGWSQKNIANILKVSEQSIARWKREGDWDRRKLTQSSMLLKSEEDLITAISHQTRIISLIAKRQAKDLEQNNIADLTVAELQKFLLDPKDLDGYSKLAAKLDKKAPGWEELIKVMRRFMGWLTELDVKAAQDIAELVDQFINQSRG